MGLGVVGVVATGVAAYGAYSASQAAAANSRYQGQVAKNNATIAGQNAAYATAAGEEAATNQSLKGAATGARIKAAQAANGVDINSGSAVDVQTSQREASSLDTAQTMHDAILKAYGYKVDESNATAQSSLDTAQAGQEETAGYISAAGSLLGGASGVSNIKWGSGYDYSGQTAGNNYGSGALSGGGV